MLFRDEGCLEEMSRGCEGPSLTPKSLFDNPITGGEDKSTTNMGLLRRERGAGYPYPKKDSRIFYLEEMN